MESTVDLSGLPKPVADDIRRLVEALKVNQSRSTSSENGRSSSMNEFERELDLLCDGLPKLGVLPTPFSRAEIYENHD
jgi:hypothetical protein